MSVADEVYADCVGSNSWTTCSYMRLYARTLESVLGPRSGMSNESGSMKKDDVIEEVGDGPSSLTQRQGKNEKERENVEACGKIYFMTSERKSASHREIPSARKVYQMYRVPTSITKELTISFMVVKHTTRVAS